MARTARVLRTLWLTSAIVVVAAAVLLTVTRLLLPLAENFRDDLAVWASEALGHPVTVGRISARWHRWGPELALFDVRLGDTPGGPAVLHFDEVHIGVDLMQAVREQRIHPSTIRVIGTRLALERRGDGRLQLQGLGIGAEGEGGYRAAGVAWLFTRRHLLLEKADLVFVDRRHGAQPLELSNINLELRNDGDHHQLAGRLQLPESIGRNLTVALDAYDLIATSGEWRAQLHLQVEGVQLASLAARLPAAAPPITGGTADLELWGDMRQGLVDSLVGRVGLTGVAVREGAEPVSLFAAAGGDFAWRRQHDGWRLQGRGVRLAHAGTSWPAGGFQVEYQAADSERAAALEARWDYLRIDELMPLLRTAAALPERWREIATQLAPTGAIRAARLQAQLGGSPRFRFQGELDEIGFQPWNKVPGIQGLSAHVVADERSGRAQVESRNLRLDAPRYFRGPFGVALVTGALEWARVGEGWGVAVRQAALSDPRGKGRAVLDVEWQPEQGAFLDVSAAFVDADAADISPFIPAGKLPPKTVAWLDRAIVGGKSPQGRLVYRGRIKQFPFPARQGRFHIRFDAEQAVLDYQPGWPRFEGLGGAVEFEEATLRVHARQGTILGARLLRADAEVADLKSDPKLTVSSRIELPLASGIGFLRESPLSEGFRERLAGLKAGGAASLALDLSIPLRAGSQPEVAGTLDVMATRLESDVLPAPLERLRGQVRFTEALVEGEGLSGQWLGGAVRFDIKAPLAKHRASSPAGTVRAGGQAQAAALAKLLAQPALAERLAGQTRWEATWRLPRRTGGAGHLDVSSDLEGLSIDLPLPVGKTAAQKKPLTVSVELADDQQQEVALRYADSVDARLRFRRQRTGQGSILERGEVRVGGARARLPGEPGLTVAGDLARLAIADWRIGLGSWGKGWDLSGGMLQRVVLRIGTLLGARQQIRDVRLAVEKGQGYWEGSVHGAGAKGYLRVPFQAGDDPVLLRFDWLRLERDPAAQEDRSDAWPDPQRTPPIDITVADLSLNGEALGKLALRTARVKGGMRIARFLVQGENLQFDASGEWMGDGQASRSAIEMRMESSNLGRLLKALDYAEGVNNGRLTAEAQLSWPGPPGAPDLSGLSGRLALTIRRGRLVDIEPGAGRIFGLLSFQALPRRLIFDFRDFFLQGFSFDVIAGDFRINSGDAYSDNLSIEGPAARIEIIGRTGLEQRDYDQLVTVIPNVTGGLPLAGWAAGGPAVGAVMLFFQKMFGKRIDASSGIRYRVTGGWEDPTLVKLTPSVPPDTRDAN